MGIFHTASEVVHTFSDVLPEKWEYVPEKCEAGNEGCQTMHQKKKKRGNETSARSSLSRPMRRTFPVNQLKKRQKKWKMKSKTLYSRN